MNFSDSFFASKFALSQGNLESYLSLALSQGGDYADIYFQLRTRNSDHQSLSEVSLTRFPASGTLSGCRHLIELTG
jgi:hypothetical protein